MRGRFETLYAMCVINSVKVTMKTDPTLDIHNVMSITRLMIHLGRFWPRDGWSSPEDDSRAQAILERHNIEIDISALCFTLVLLLKLGVMSDLEGWGEDMKILTREVAGILEEKTPDVLSTATRLTFLHIYRALSELEKGWEPRYDQMVDEHLKEVLQVIRHALRRFEKPGDEINSYVARFGG